MADFLKHYKHKTISRFSVGPYHFVNHLLKIESEEENTDFLREVKGLLMVDQINIIEVMNLENERPLDLSQRATRGMLGTAGVKLQDSTAEGKAAENERRAQELTEWEANLAARERRLPPQAVIDPAPADPITADDAGQVSAESEQLAEEQQPAPAPAPAPIKVGGLKLGSNQ